MTSVTKFLALTAVVVACLSGGCDPSVIYSPWTGGTYGASITPRTTWRASGSITNPRNAIDDDLLTAASSGYQKSGGEIVIDLGKKCLFSMVIIDHGESRDGYARRVGVATSTTGKVYTERYTAPGSRRVTHVLLPQPTMARYVRLRVAAAGRRPWSVAEVYLQ